SPCKNNAKKRVLSGFCLFFQDLGNLPEYYPAPLLTTCHQPLIMSSNAGISRMFRPYPRLAMKSPDREVALRNEHVVRAKTTLVLRPARDDTLEVGYRIVHEDGTPMYTVTGRKFGDSSTREFRDTSGLP